MRVHPTVTASTMIARFNFGRKVRCHNGAVEILRLSRGPGRRMGNVPSVPNSGPEFLVEFRHPNPSRISP
jgi:hypothetical protein